MCAAINSAVSNTSGVLCAEARDMYTDKLRTCEKNSDSECTQTVYFCLLICHLKTKIAAQLNKVAICN